VSVFETILGRVSGNDRTAILGSEAMTYGDLLREADGICAMLRAAGARPGDLMALSLPHGSAYISTLLGARAAGLVLVPMSPLAKPQEVAHMLSDSGARFMVHAGADLEALQIPGKAVGWLLGNRLVELADAGSFVAEAGDEWIVYTSGSTGKPKGVVLTSSGFAANVAGVCAVLGLGPEDRSVAFTPPHYTLALSLIFTHLWVGGAVLPMSRGLLNPLGMLQSAASAGVTGLQLNPGILRSLLTTVGDDWPAMERLRYVLFVGQPLTDQLVRELLNKCPEIKTFNSYGCTENSPRIAMKRLDPLAFESSGYVLPVGQAVAATSVAILDDGGRTCESGVLGEVAIKGDSLMRTYVKAQWLMDERLTHGWFRTRDLGFIDSQGDLHLSGRIDNIIRVGHEKVSPEEVEEVIRHVKGVLDVAVVGIPDPQLFEVPVVLVAYTNESEPVLSDIKAHLRMRLSRAKMPRHFYAVASIPLTPYGKTDRTRVRALVKSLMGGDV
jgi:acyl-CoA synthetase (AMP-forming)/AMP-acid ligase II